MLRISEAQLETIKSRFKGLQERVKAAKEKANEVLTVVIRSAEVGATIFGLCVVQGKTGGVVVFGVPLDLGLGVLAHVAGFMGLGGRLSDHLHNFGDGAIGAYLAATGRSIGLQWKAKAQGALPSSATKGSLGDGNKGQSLTEEEMERIAAR